VELIALFFVLYALGQLIADADKAEQRLISRLDQCENAARYAAERDRIHDAIQSGELR
jgi:hypothetical protein